MERQIHGFKYEKKYILEHDLIEEKEYGSQFDAFDKNNVPYQIKCIKKGSAIDMGDIFRNANKKTDFFLVIGFWEKSKERIVEEYRLFIPVKKWNKYFKFDRYDELKTWIRDKVSNDYCYDKTWKLEMKEWKKAFGKRFIQPRFKRDHKSQRRIQCAINKKDFYSHFLTEYKVE